MSNATALGYVAGFLTTLAFLPQVLKAWRTGSTEDLSWVMLFFFGCGVALWIVYGLMLEEPPIILFNAITLGLTLVLATIKFRHDRPK
jgi:MtN3 and saliva related transmembrane protein